VRRNSLIAVAGVAVSSLDLPLKLKQLFLSLSPLELLLELELVPVEPSLLYPLLLLAPLPLVRCCLSRSAVAALTVGFGVVMLQCTLCWIESGC